MKFDCAKDVFDRIYWMFNGITWYVQAILNRMYERKSTATTAALSARVPTIKLPNYPTRGARRRRKSTMFTHRMPSSEEGGIGSSVTTVFG